MHLSTEVFRFDVFLDLTPLVHELTSHQLEQTHAGDQQECGTHPGIGPLGIDGRAHEGHLRPHGLVELDVINHLHDHPDGRQHHQQGASKRQVRGPEPAQHAVGGQAQVVGFLAHLVAGAQVDGHPPRRVEIADHEQVLEVGIASGLFPLLIFLGVGAMTDFSALIANPRMLFLGAAAQFGIFATLFGAIALNWVPGLSFTLKEASAIAIIGGADGPTAIFLASRLAPDLLGAIAVAGKAQAKIGVVNVALSVLAIADTWQMAIYGLVLLVAIIADERFARSARKRAGEAV